MNQRPIFVGDGESVNMINVLPQKLTLEINSDFWSPKKSGDKTPFKEVTIKPFEYTEEMNDLLNRPSHPKVDIYDLYEIFKKGIEKRWNPDKFHVIGHSSGTDSRLICKAIRDLTKKNGTKWAGDVLYIENMGEWEIFSKIKDRLGINGIAIKPDNRPGWFYRDYLDNIHEKFNGAVAYPLNQWWDGYAQLYDQRIIPLEVQGFTGYGGNETQQLAIKKGYEWYFSWMHKFQLMLFKTWGGEWVHPFLDIDFLHAMKSCEATYNKGRLSVIMARNIVKELIDIPHIHTKDVRSMGYRTIDRVLLSELYEKYQNTWFGKKFNVKPSQDVNYNQWWFYYYMSHLCKYLINNGHKINYI